MSEPTIARAWESRRRVLRGGGLAAAGRPPLRRATRRCGDRPLRRAAARARLRRRAEPRPGAPRRRPAGLKAAAHLAGEPERYPPGGARPRGRLAGPGIRAERLARAGARERLSPKLGDRRPPVRRGPTGSPAGAAADERAAEAILGVLGSEDLSEPAVAVELGVLLPETATLFVASSMPVREIETFWPVRDVTPRACCATVARTESTGPCRARSAPPRMQTGQSCC